MKDKTYAILIFIPLFLIIPLSFMISCNTDKSPLPNEPEQVDTIVNMDSYELKVFIDESDLKDSVRDQIRSEVKEQVYNYVNKRGIEHDDVWITLSIKVSVGIHEKL